MTALLGETCAFQGIDVNQPMCSDYDGSLATGCLGNTDSGLTFCSRPCDLANDDCGDDFTGGCCVDIGDVFEPDPWCLTAETGACGE